MNTSFCDLFGSGKYTNNDARYKEFGYDFHRSIDLVCRMSKVFADAGMPALL